MYDAKNQKAFMIQGKWNLYDGLSLSLSNGLTSSVFQSSPTVI